jgi:hypothetical protein
MTMIDSISASIFWLLVVLVLLKVVKDSVRK